MGTVIKLQVQNHFGDCPQCRKNDGHLNIGRDHWFYCKKHRVKWPVGSDIFPDWRREDESTWKQNEEFLSFLWEIEPTYDGHYPDLNEIIAEMYDRRQPEPAIPKLTKNSHLSCCLTAPPGQ